MAELDDALDALRTYSTPGLRARLVERAWNAGGTVVAIAEAGRMTRQTVYIDLRSRGVDPNTDRTGGTVSTSTLDMEIEGLTGDREHDEAVLRSLDTQYLDRLQDGPMTDSERKERFTAWNRAYDIALLLRHFPAVSRAMETEAAARTARDRALHRAQTRWEELSSAERWHAAHHAWIVAVDEARTAIEAWHKTALEVCAATEGMNDFHSLAESIPVEYGIILPEQITAACRPGGFYPSTVDSEAKQLREALDRTYEARQALAAQTLGVGRGDAD